MPSRPPSARPPARAPVAAAALAPTEPLVPATVRGLGTVRGPATTRRLATALALAAALVGTAALTGCAGGGDAFAPPADETERAARIAQLEARLETDRAALANLVASRPADERTPLHADPELRALADRIMADQAALDRLRRGSPPGVDGP